MHRRCTPLLVANPCALLRTLMFTTLTIHHQMTMRSGTLTKILICLKSKCFKMLNAAPKWYLLQVAILVHCFAWVWAWNISSLDTSSQDTMLSRRQEQLICIVFLTSSAVKRCPIQSPVWIWLMLRMPIRGFQGHGQGRSERWLQHQVHETVGPFFAYLCIKIEE